MIRNLIQNIFKSTCYSIQMAQVRNGNVLYFLLALDQLLQHVLILETELFFLIFIHLFLGLYGLNIPIFCQPKPSKIFNIINRR